MKMKPLSLILFIIACIAYSPTNAEWKDLESAAHHFSITFFGTPKFKIDTTITTDFPMYSHIWYSEVTDTTHPNTYYAVSSTMVPDSIIISDSSQAQIDNLLLATVRGYSTGFEYKVSQPTPIEIEGYPGKEFKIKNNQYNYWFSIRSYVVRNQIIILIVKSEGNLGFNPVIKQFFDSFELYNIQPGKYKLAKQEIKTTFTADFPKTPRIETKTVESQSGALTIQSNICMLDDTTKDIYGYAVVVTNYPENFQIETNPQSLNSYYNSSVKEYLTTIGAEIKTMGNSTVGGMQSKIFSAYMVNGTAEITAQMVYNARKLYMIFAITKPDKNSKSAIDKFFNSFKLIK